MRAGRQVARSRQASVTRASVSDFVAARTTCCSATMRARPSSTSVERDVEPVAEPRRLPVVDVDAMDDERDRRARARARASSKPSDASHSVRARSMNLR